MAYFVFVYSMETHKTASIAADRSGNERAARLRKLADVFANHEHNKLPTGDIILYGFPKASKSISCDRKFSTMETLNAASIAADRSGNERAVRVCKLADVFANYEHKPLKTADIVRLCDLWLTQSFQVNFMYKTSM